jgi:RNA polymerase sigma-70 factor (ECF subfamily)
MADPHELEPLLARTRQGDGAARNALMERLRPWVLCLARRRLGGDGPHEASDVAHEALLRVHVNLSRCRADGVPQFLAWVRQIVERAVVDHWHETGRQPPACGDEHLLGGLFGGGDTPDHRALDDELALRLAWAVERLRPAQRAVIQARFFDGLSFAEVAARVGKSVGAVRVVCVRALERLRRDRALEAFRPDGGTSP